MTKSFLEKATEAISITGEKSEEFERDNKAGEILFSIETANNKIRYYQITILEDGQ